MTDVKFPDRVRKLDRVLRQSVLDDDQLNTYEFYRLDHPGWNGSGDSPTGKTILEPQVSERKFHLSICGFQNLSAQILQSVHDEGTSGRLLENSCERGLETGPNVKHKVRGKIANAIGRWL